jgi:hypothetical protein
MQLVYKICVPGICLPLFPILSFPRALVVWFVSTIAKIIEKGENKNDKSWQKKGYDMMARLGPGSSLLWFASLLAPPSPW